MGTDTTENVENTGRLISLIRSAYPDAYMTMRHWKTFPTSYAIMSGDLKGKHGNFMLGASFDSKEDAWAQAWDTVEQLTLEQLKS